MNDRIKQYLADQGRMAAPPPVQSQQTQQQQSGINRLQSAANKLVQCELCGGTYMFEIVLQQYRPGYSASAGGDLQPISDAPQSLRMCLCGNVIAPNIGGVRGGRTPNAMLDSLLADLKAAKEKRAESAQQVSNLATAVSEQMAEMQEGVNKLEAALVDLGNQMLNQKVETVQEALAALKETMAPVTDLAGASTESATAARTTGKKKPGAAKSEPAPEPKEE